MQIQFLLPVKLILPIQFQAPPQVSPHCQLINNINILRPATWRLPGRASDSCLMFDYVRDIIYYYYYYYYA